MKTKRMDKDGNKRSQGYRVYEDTGDAPALRLGGGLAGGSHLIKVNKKQNEEQQTNKVGRTDEAKKIRKENMKKGKDYSPFQAKKVEFIKSDTMNTVTCATQKDNLLCIQKTGGYCTTIKNDETGTLQSGGANVMDKVPNVLVRSNTKKGFEEAKEGDSINLSMPKSKTRRGRVGVGVAQTLDTQVNQATIIEGNIRRLTEIECERLQGFPDNWTKFGVYEKQVWINKKLKTFKIVEGVYEIPRTQRYKLVGNAVTTKIVALIGRKLLNR